MERCEVYKELKSYRQELGKCDSLVLRKKELRARLGGIKITSYGEHIRAQGSDTLEVLIDKITKCDEAIARAILDSEDKRKRIEAKIEQLEFPCGEVLRRRYIDGQSYERICVGMSSLYKREYCYQVICNIHCKAIKQYQDL